MLNEGLKPEIRFEKARRVFEAVLGVADLETAERVSLGVGMPKAPSDNRRLEWVLGMCAELEGAFGEAEVRTVRENSGCTPPAAKGEKVRRLFEKSRDLAEFCERFNAEYAPGNSLETDGAALRFVYPECYCACVKALPAPLPRAWCYCSLGYAKKLFSYALSRDVEVELSDSVKTGGERCVMLVTFD